MRTLIVAGCLLLGFVAGFLANVAVWADRTVFDEEQFVATATPVFDDKGVQDAIAAALVEQLELYTGGESRIQDELPDGLRFLAAPLAVGGRQALVDGISRALASDLTGDLRARLLREAHAQGVAILEGDSTAVETRDGVVYLDLRPVLAAVLEDAGLADSVLGSVTLPDDAGHVEIARETGEYKLARPLVAHHTVVAAVLAAASGALFVIAVGLADTRRRALAAAGALVFLVGAGSVLGIPPLREFAAEQSRNPAVARSVIDLVSHGFLLQSAAIALAGLGLTAVTLLAPGRSSRRPRAGWR